MLRLYIMDLICTIVLCCPSSKKKSKVWGNTPAMHSTGASM